MTAIGARTFAVILWAAILCVGLVFVYEVYAIAVEYGWVP